MSNTGQTTSSPTGIQTIDSAIAWTIYIIAGTTAFFASMYIYVMFVMPQIASGELFIFVVWFCVTIYLIGKMR